MDLASSQNAQILLNSDTNSRSVFWNELQSNPRGVVWENFIAKNSLVVLNKGNNVTYFRHNASSILDVAMATPKLSEYISNFQTCQYCPASDHVGITYALNLGSGANGPKRVVRKTNWKGFKADIDQKSNDLKNALDAAEPIAGVEFNQRYLGINDVESGAVSLNSDINECIDKEESFIVDVY